MRAQAVSHLRTGGSRPWCAVLNGHSMYNYLRLFLPIVPALALVPLITSPSFISLISSSSFPYPSPPLVLALPPRSPASRLGRRLRQAPGAPMRAGCRTTNPPDVTIPRDTFRVRAAHVPSQAVPGAVARRERGTRVDTAAVRSPCTSRIPVHSCHPTAPACARTKFAAASFLCAKCILAQHLSPTPSFPILSFVPVRTRPPTQPTHRMSLPKS
ncbi:hypothetical protein B0H16DRAFT_1860006 [Mycena metata]|uniref:Uncharacterized protein n=1 Tax=Mycena metata TaxID=1033252 RepID=A0AAD7IHU5_9AGAR|nr:hypothetical protein B0H16DRAFT_1860006 [Mycena metata]